MALLLRMGGVPARVATGFTPGSLDRKQREYVVRDLDAHSWVEVWFPGIGWVTFDPTPAAAPPRAQPGDAAAGASAGAAPRRADLGGDIASDPSTAAARAGGGTRGSPDAIGGVVAVALWPSARLRAPRRRRLPPPAHARWPSSSARCAARATTAGPGATLRASSARFAGWPGAAGYVRALREQRYSGRHGGADARAAPRPAAALAREPGRLRAWWALPPRAPVRRRRPALARRRVACR